MINESELKQRLYLKSISLKMKNFDAFKNYINSLSEVELQEELTNLYKDLEQVRIHYLAKNIQATRVDENLLKKYKSEITRAIYPNKYMEGGLNTDKVKNILKPFQSSSTSKYFIELGLFAVEECTNIANEFGGDYGEDFYIYFEELFEDIVNVISRENLEDEYKIRLEDMVNSAFDGYGHYDQLKDVLNEHL